MKIFKHWFFKHLFKNQMWYRKWHGGRWEGHWDEVCCGMVWFNIEANKGWPQYKYCLSHGAPLIEIWEENA